MFFRFPWNNFLHNVVYDIVQQVFNGQIDVGQNRRLAIDLFETGHITSRIIEGQAMSDLAEAKDNVRLGYMGHLTLIAEEVVKFSERYSPENLSQSVYNSLTSQEWISYVDQKLAETRERDNAVLGGIRPDPRSMPGIPGLSLALAGKWSAMGSAALADAGLTGNVAADAEEVEGAEFWEVSGDQRGGLLDEFESSQGPYTGAEGGRVGSGSDFAIDPTTSVRRNLSFSRPTIMAEDIESWDDIEDGTTIDFPEMDMSKPFRLDET